MTPTERKLREALKEVSDRAGALAFKAPPGDSTDRAMAYSEALFLIHSRASSILAQTSNGDET